MQKRYAESSRAGSLLESALGEREGRAKEEAAAQMRRVQEEAEQEREAAQRVHRPFHPLSRALNVELKGPGSCAGRVERVPSPSGGASRHQRGSQHHSRLSTAIGSGESH